jgi:hypothetical protein
MADYATPIIVGLSSLLGAGVGGFIAHYSTMRSHNARVAQEKHTRRLAQLERLDISLETINEHAASLVMQATNTIALDRKLDVKEIPKAQLASVEFLVQVYLHNSTHLFSELKLAYASVMERVVRALAESVNREEEQSTSTLTDAIEAQYKMLEVVKKIRHELVKSARSIEGI